MDPMGFREDHFILITEFSFKGLKSPSVLGTFKTLESMIFPFTFGGISIVSHRTRSTIIGWFRVLPPRK